MLQGMRGADKTCRTAVEYQAWQESPHFSQDVVRGAVKILCKLCVRQHDYLPGGRCGVGIAQLGRGGQHAVLVGRDLCAEGQGPNKVLAQLANVQQPHLPASEPHVSRLHAAGQLSDTLCH